MIIEQRLQQALETIGEHTYSAFQIHDEDTQRTLSNTDELLELYGNTRWYIIELLNQQYQLNSCLSNWLQEKNDEVASFLMETGSNALNYSTYKIPAKYHLWQGKTGFIIGIEQKGRGFPASVINRRNIKQNEGRAFDFFRNSKASIFFDNPHNARIIYFTSLTSCATSQTP